MNKSKSIVDPKRAAPTIIRFEESQPSIAEISSDTMNTSGSMMSRTNADLKGVVDSSGRSAFTQPFKDG